MANPTELLSRLTIRESEILTLIARGHSNREIADKLFIGETSINHHTYSLYDKLELELALPATRRIKSALIYWRVAAPLTNGDMELT
jgi:DNA-binding NarL/FixJ family response regulator